MRIVAGTFGGRRIVAPPGSATRPTSDRVREALFAILGPLDGAAVLDLYAGSGALGLEALSRGASHATLVERGSAALAALRANVAALGVEQDVEVVPSDASAHLRTARSAARQYDLILLDPPYRHPAGLAHELSTALEPLLAPGARVVAESDRRVALALALPLRDERRYGNTLIRIHQMP